MAMSLLVIPYSCSNVSPLTEVRKQQRQRVEHCPPTLSSFHLDCNARHCPSGHVVACISSSSSSHSNVSSPTKLYISGLSFQTTEETLRNAFVQFVEEDKYRSFSYGEGEKNTTWIHGAPPNFDVVDKLFEEGRTQEWPLGSLEEKVQRLVKTMEMELFHKANPKDYKAIDPSRFTFAVNGRKGLTMAELRQLGGGYNGFLQTSLPEELRLYDYTKETMESSHKLFTTTFPRGFAFEILKAYSGPPVIAYKFRHWAWMEGPFKGYPPTGELVELFGIGIFEVDEQMRVIKVEFFYDSGELLGALMKGGKGVSSSSDDTKMGCPFLGNTAPKY